MKEALLLLFLISLYNFLLYYVTVNDLSAIPLFPKDPLNTIIVLSFNAVLYIGWFFGERRKLVTILGYLFFIQITLLSLIYRDPYVFVANLFPVILTFMLVVLFESPFERRQREIQREREELLKELEELERERKEVEEKIQEYRRSLAFLRIQLKEKERQLSETKERKEEEHIKEEIEHFKRRIREMEEELKKQREKEKKLLDSNRKLFQMLELLGREEEKTKGSREVKELRKERKKLIKEVLELQELLNLYEKENRELREELESLREEAERLRRELAELRLKKEELERASQRREDLYGEVLRSLFPSFQFSEEFLREFVRTDTARKKALLGALEKLREGVRPERVTTLQGVYRLRMSGGRLYLRRKGDTWEVLGFLDSEEDKDKARFIKSLEDKV
ncbi:MAG: hypothetical protein GXN96_00050 [Aquificae bacterium]|nr:hypothetical protein [Aquificota bacterium]